MKTDKSLWTLVLCGLWTSAALLFLIVLQAAYAPISETSFVQAPVVFGWLMTLGVWLQAACFAISLKLLWRQLTSTR